MSWPSGGRWLSGGKSNAVYWYTYWGIFSKKILNRVDCQRSGQRSKHTKQTRNQQNTQLRYILFTTSRPRRLHPGEHWKRKEKGASPVCERMIHRFRMPLHAGSHSKSSSHRLRLCSRGLLTWCFSRQWTIAIARQDWLQRQNTDRQIRSDRVSLRLSHQTFSGYNMHYVYIALVHEQVLKTRKHSCNKKTIQTNKQTNPLTKKEQ